MGNSLLFEDINSLNSSGLVAINGGLTESFTRPVPNQLQQAYDIQLDFTIKLIESAGGGDKWATRAVEDMLDGTKTLAMIIKEYDGGKGALGKAHTMLKESFLHTSATFRNAISSAINLRLIEAWDLCTSCWENYMYVAPDDTACERNGTWEMLPLQKGVRNRKRIKEGGVTHSRWKFGEQVRGQYCVHLFGDSVEWTWKLEDCSKFDLLTMFINRLTEAHNEGKTLDFLELYSGVKGINPTVFNTANANLVPNNPLPTRESINEAIRLINTKTDEQGRPLCNNRGYVFVAFDFSIANQIAELVTTTETRKTTDSGDVNIIRGNGLYGNVEVCHETYGRMIATDLHSGSVPFYTTSWFLFVKPERGKRNAIEVSHYKGFKTPRLFKKAPNTTTLGGTPLAGHGDFDTMNREIKIMSGYGGGVQFTELMVASRGDEVDGDLP